MRTFEQAPRIQAHVDTFRGFDGNIFHVATVFLGDERRFVVRSPLDRYVLSNTDCEEYAHKFVSKSEALSAARFLAEQERRRYLGNYLHISTERAV